MLLQMLFFTAAILLCAVQNQRIHEAIKLDPELFCACAHISKLVSTGVENAVLIVMRQFIVNFILHEDTPSMKKKFVARRERCLELEDWIPFIVQHFEQLKGGSTIQPLDASSWWGVLEDLCEGNLCARGPCLPHSRKDLSRPNIALTDSKALAVLKKIIFDPTCQRTFQFYLRFRSVTEDWERSLKYQLQCLLDTIAVIPSVHGISDRDCALVKQYLFVCETRDSWCQAFEDIVGDCRVYVQSIARAFVFMRQKYLEADEKQKGAHIIDLTFLAHGQVQSPMLPCSVHYLNDRVQSITLYEPWGCALHASAAYGILTGNISTDKVSYTDNVLPAKPSEWNTLPKDYTQIPEVVFNRGSTNESVFKMLNHLFDVLHGSVRGLVIPYFQPEGAIELPEIPLWALTNAVGLLGWICDKRFRIHIAACLLPNSRTSLTHEIYKYPGNTINCRQYCVVPINPSPGVVVTMKIPEFDIPENVQQAFPVLNALLGTPESEN